MDEDKHVGDCYSLQFITVPASIYTRMLRAWHSIVHSEVFRRIVVPAKRRPDPKHDEHLRRVIQLTIGRSVFYVRGKDGPWDLSGDVDLDREEGDEDTKYTIARGHLRLFNAPLSDPVITHFCPGFTCVGRRHMKQEFLEVCYKGI